MSIAFTAGVPDRCLCFTVASSLGHFRRVDRSGTKQTYRIIPRTTAAGLIAAIAGWERDEYYETFRTETSAMSISITGGVRTLSQSRYELGTNPDVDLTGSGGTGRASLRVKYPDGARPRQLRTYEYLVEPAYRICVALSDHQRYEQLKDKLVSGHTHYPVSMGKSEYLATVEYHGEAFPTPIKSETTVDVDSAVPTRDATVIPTTDRVYRERVPGYMRADTTGRQTMEFIDYAFTKDTPLTLATAVDGTAQVMDQTDVFC
ncbi:type I-B CRISPR-associated protein Cas5 [Haloferax sp. Atlit-6N]|uniref:type I-B CRISPR-associated protein Cas5b n=1 Tax=Haloferax sp. Atlit-6N TaxID=2077205 RepID=UPI000E2400CA|nr:type I-B CRISPR-associated protein Cas5b [Haloferax sp. Atlit-6N]REA02048.1 type I-B CRISPR-associated protein Cas5 [Haloferax sp. Atlit-6N]